MKTTYRKVLSRRTLLRGGGVALALPFLEEMTTTSLYAQEPAAPIRAFNVFFGLGYQMDLQKRGLSGGVPAQPLVDKFGDRLAFLRGISNHIADGSGNAHYDGSGSAFTGTPTDKINKSKSVTGGASIDQALRLALSPNLPAGQLNALNTGTWWRFSDSSQRYIHSRLGDGNPAGDAKPPQDPTELFDKLFAGVKVGGPPMQPGPTPEVPMTDNAAAKARAMNRSVIDSLMTQYSHYSGPGGGLGADSRARVKLFFEQVRALELEVNQGAPEGSVPSGPAPTTVAATTCSSPAKPDQKWIPHRNSGDGGGIDVNFEAIDAEVRLMAKLFAMGIACDMFRFGSFVFQSGGERIRIHGDYSYNGKLIKSWDEKTTSHELWHGNKYDDCADHLHFSMGIIAHLFEQLDAIKENGKSVFDTSMICVSTESGNGRHDSGELHNVMHVLNSAGGRFKVGAPDFVDIKGDGIDLYNTMLKGMGVPKDKLLWDGRGDLSQILV